MLCVVIKGPSFENAAQQINEASAIHADLVELRLDCFDSLDPDSLKKLHQDYLIPKIFTLRSKSQGGFFTGSEESRLETIKCLANFDPEYLDLECDVPASFVSEISKCHPGIKIIISHHEFGLFSKSLDNIYKEMCRIPASFYKIAIPAESTSTALNMLTWKKNYSNTLITISMGLQGQVSRILGPIFQTPITYACLNTDLATAPGQLSASTLKELYRYHHLNPRTAICGLIGDPIACSISDVTHNAVFKACGLDAVYVKMQVKEAELQEFLHLAKHIPFRGLSITMPLKESILQFIDYVDPKAQEIGAVNTLRFQDDKLYGYNTDSFGALNAIERQLPVKGKRIIIIGAGGAAKAIAYEACIRGALVIILNRNAERAYQIANHIHCQANGLANIESYVKSGYDIIINTTPSPMPIDPVNILSNTLAMDIRTRPKQTEFLKHAAAKGCRIVYGYEMFTEQAIGQFQAWFGDTLNFQLAKEILFEKSMECLE